MAIEQKTKKYIQTDEIMLTAAIFNSFFELLSALKIKNLPPDTVENSIQFPGSQDALKIIVFTAIVFNLIYEVKNLSTSSIAMEKRVSILISGA